MWAEIGGRTEAQITEHDRRYRTWVRTRMKSGEIIGVLAEAPGVGPVASGCVWFRPDHPRPVIKASRSPYILSVFTDPAYRRQGLATRIVKDLLEISRKRGYVRATLHASDMGKNVYAQIGFEPWFEWRYWLDPSKRPKHR
jgi:GNAT superfamily N-acetyltransferase